MAPACARHVAAVFPPISQPAHYTSVASRPGERADWPCTWVAFGAVPRASSVVPARRRGHGEQAEHRHGMPWPARVSKSKLMLLRHPDQWWGRLNARSVVCKLAPLLELVGLAIAEVAEDETWMDMSWMDTRDETADSRLRMHCGAAAESWHSAGDGRRWTGSSAKPTTSRVNVQCTWREAA